MRPVPRSLLDGLTLVEMLIVTTVIAILASLLLAGVAQSRQKAKRIVCINNLHQISIGIDLYQQNNQHRFPLRVSQKGSTGNPPNPTGTREDWLFFDLAIGGVDPSNAPPGLPRAKERPLFAYLGPSQAYRCPLDAGWDFSPTPDAALPTAFIANGCSYQYNANPATRGEPLGLEGIAGKPESWVTNPARFILMYEPPARDHQVSAAQPYLVFWHGSSKPGTLRWDGSWSSLIDRGRLISPILFVDGHVKVLDFTQNSGIMANTAEWQWFKPTR